MMRLRSGWLITLSLALAPFTCSAQSSEASDAIAEIKAHLEVGEYAPARALAESLSNRTVRDGQLTKIAASQASAGGKSASLATIGMMRDDYARAAALDSISEWQNEPRGASGGTQADFDSLIELIISTVAPTTWDGVGGPGSIAPFATGVLIDTDGVLRRLERKSSSLLATLVKREQPVTTTDSEVSANDGRRGSHLRKISLPRLERAIQLRNAAGKAATDEMRLLAGLQKIQYVLVYPESGDVVLAGPAGNWTTNADGRIVGADSGRPVVQLDDLVVIWRHLAKPQHAIFGCSITPTQEGLARTKAFVEASSKNPLKPGRRDQWLTQLREQLGRQTIEVYNIDPRTRTAQVLVEADHHMKLIGMGLEDGAVGVTSYLDSIHVPPGQAPPPMDVLRWWFTMNYRALLATADHDGFELRGQGVQVQSENELINQGGERVHTGKSSVLNQEFAQSFTEHFAALATKYPVYADMQNLFDLALSIAIIRSEKLADRADWHALYFGDTEGYVVPLGAEPKEVDSIMNHRIINQKHILVGVSGGVRIDPWPEVSESKTEIEKYGQLKSQRTSSAAPKQLETQRWWWD